MNIIRQTQNIKTVTELQDALKHYAGHTPLSNQQGDGLTVSLVSEDDDDIGDRTLRHYLLIGENA